MLPQRTLITSVAASVIALSLASGASAEVSAEAVLAGLQRQYSLQGIEIAAGSTQSRGDDVVFSDVKLTMTDADQAIAIDEIVLEDVVEAPQGGFIIGRAAVPAFNSEKDGFSIAFEGAALEGYFVAGPDEQDPVLKSGLFRTATVGGIAIGKGAAPFLTLQGATVEMGPYEAGGTMDSKVELKDFSLDFTQLDDPKAKMTASELGYEQVTGRMSAEGSWDAATGDLSVVQSFMIDDAATLNMQIAIGGYTSELVAAMQQLNLQMSGQSEEAKGLAMLGLMQQLQFASMSIELDDDSVTGRILDFVAKQQGANRESVVAMAKGTLPVALMQLQNPAFAASATAAIGAFLDNPGSLTIEASPAAPVSVAQIAAAAMAAPQSLVDTLGLKITANE